MRALGLDVGGTHVKVALLENGALVDESSAPTGAVLTVDGGWTARA